MVGRVSRPTPGSFSIKFPRLIVTLTSSQSSFPAPWASWAQTVLVRIAQLATEATSRNGIHRYRGGSLEGERETVLFY
jgi:hypothetical protein